MMGSWALPLPCPHPVGEASPHKYVLMDLPSSVYPEAWWGNRVKGLRWLLLPSQRAQLPVRPNLATRVSWGRGRLTWYRAAAAAAKSLQSCPTLCDPIDGSPPGSPIPGILQARTLEWVAISFSNAWKRKVKVKSLSRVQLCGTPSTAAHQAPPSMGFSRQEYWSTGVGCHSLLLIQGRGH